MPIINKNEVSEFKYININELKTELKIKILINLHLGLK